MGIESPVEDVVCEAARKAGWVVRKFAWVGSRGGLDRLFAKDGRIIFIEFKAPGKLKNTSSNQDKTIKELTSAGIECHVVDTTFRAYKILGISPCQD